MIKIYILLFFLIPRNVFVIHLANSGILDIGYFAGNFVISIFKD